MVLSLLIYLRKIPVVGKVFKFILLVCGLDLPASVKMGKNIKFPHNSLGTVIHPNTIIEDNVTIYHQVTIGRAEVMYPVCETNFIDITVKQGAILCAGAKILSKEPHMVIGQNSIVAANSVLTHSIGENEIWGGVPARLLGHRKTDVLYASENEKI